MAQRTFKPDAEKIERLRVQKGWALPDLVRESGVANRTVDAVMHGKNVVISTMARIAKALGVTPESIIVGFEQPAAPDTSCKSAMAFEFLMPYSDFDESVHLPRIVAAFKMMAIECGGIVADPTTEFQVKITIEVVTSHLYVRASGAADSNWMKPLLNAGAHRIEYTLGDDLPPQLNLGDDVDLISENEMLPPTGKPPKKNSTEPRDPPPDWPE